MRVALICEKPSLAKRVIDELLFVEPNMDHSAFVVGWANEFYHLNSAFVIPRGQAYQSFPMTREVKFRPMTFDGQYFDSERKMPIRRGVSANPVRENRSGYDSIIDNEDFISSLKRADLVYIAFDASPSGYHVQLRVIDWLKSLDASFVVKHLPIMSLVSADIHNGLVNAKEIDDLAVHAQLSLVRRHFDYNYLLNAYPIMGMTFEKAFGKRLAWPLSKHELQVLYFMRHGKCLTEGDLFDVMKKWKGTGRYDTKGWNFYHGIGNYASRSDIMQNLKVQGLLKRAGKHSLAISSKGEWLLQSLHPDCEDPDQALRIYSWAQLPIDVAKDKVDRYIKTFFGKQKRFLTKVQTGSNTELVDA